LKNSIYIAITIVFTVIGQILTKKGQSMLGSYPQNKFELIFFLIKSLFTPYIFMGMLCAVISALSWIMALSKYKLSYAYPFVSLSYVLVMVASMLLFKEKVLPIQWAGVLTICFGLFLISRA
jgi:drug/metabolite transporter (DMT)-like permease